MNIRTLGVLVAVVLTLDACGGAPTKSSLGPLIGSETAPSGVPVMHEVVPVVVTLSTFWTTLDQQGCPVIVRLQSAPLGYTDWWDGLVRYCNSSPRDPGLVSLAGSVDREHLLALLITPCTHSADLLANAPDAIALATKICNQGKVTTSDLDQLYKIASDHKAKSAIASKFIDTPATTSSVCFGSKPTFNTLEFKNSGPEGDKFASIANAFCSRKLDLVTDASAKSAAIAFRDAQDKAGNDVNAFAATLGATSDGVGGGASGSAATTVAPSFNVGTISELALQGLAQFLEKRAELELRSYAIDKLRAIADCKTPTAGSERHRLFTHTCEFLGSDAGTLTAGFGPGLRAAFVHDIVSLPRNLVEQSEPQGGTAELFARVGLESAAVLVEDPDPMQVVARVTALSTKGGFRCTDANDKSCADALAILQIGATVAGDILTDGKPIKINGSQLLARLGGHLKDIAKAIPAGDLHDTIQKLADLDPKAWEAKVAPLGSEADAVIVNFKAARDALSNVPEGATAEVRAKAIVVATRYGLQGLDRAIAIGDCLRMLDPAKVASIDCQLSRSYIPTEVVQLLDAIGRGDITNVMVEGMQVARASLGSSFDQKIPPDVARLMSFGAELAAAQNTNDAEAAIETIAMPPGGYKEKRKRDFFSITGLVGAGGGYEWIANVPGASTTNRSLTGSLIGAVGIDYNHHISGWNWTYGVFATVLDLGALLNVRDGSKIMSGSSTQDVDHSPAIGWSQVFAPGIGLRLGISDSPAVLMAGFQVVPDGRAVTDPTTKQTTDMTTVRAMLSLSVDVTIWGF